MRKTSLLFILMFQLVTLGINAGDTYGTKNMNYWYHWNPTGDLSNSQVSNGWSALVFDVSAPQNGYTLKNGSWISRVSSALVQNRVAIEGKSKYYFAPKDISITAQDGTVYTLTPQCNANTDTYNKLLTAAGDQFTWDEATLGEVLGSHSIVYDGGVFNNDILYAYANGKYTPIVRLTQEQDFSNYSSCSTAGSLELINASDNTVLHDVLNAIGYPNLSADGNDYSQCDFDHSYKNINRQLRAWLGYVKNDGNNVAQYVEQAQYDDDNIATILVSWERPINAYFVPAQLSDLNVNQDPVYFIDYLRLYDWRGDKTRQGYMYDGHYWFWGYYNVNEIDVDLRPENILTNLNQQQAGIWLPLSSVTPYVRFSALDGTTGLQQYFFNLTSNQNFLSAQGEAALEAYMGISPVDNTAKARFGGILYENLGSNNLNATFLVPVTVRYEFGSVTATLKIIVGNGGVTEPVTQKCATPTIKVVDGEVTFECATEGVTYKATYQLDNTANTVEGGKLVLGGTTTCTISVYATKDGYEDSDVATAEVKTAWGKKGDVTGDGEVTVADAVEVVNMLLGK